MRRERTVTLHCCTHSVHTCHFMLSYVCSSMTSVLLHTKQIKSAQGLPHILNKTFTPYYKSQQWWSVLFICVCKECTFCCVLFWHSKKLNGVCNILWMFRTLTFKIFLDSQLTVSKNSIYLNGRSERGAQEWRKIKNGANECEYEWCCVYSAPNLVSVLP